jgi:3-methyladenine DNA glycosylase/8-oxoguanine DNA glycosylase
VPIREYVLMTETLARHLTPELRERAETLQEELEGLGPYTLRYVAMDALGPSPALSLQPSSLRRAVAWTRMTWRSLPYMLKLKQPCSGFRNFDARGEGVAGALQP